MAGVNARCGHSFESTEQAHDRTVSELERLPPTASTKIDFTAVSPSNDVTYVGRLQGLLREARAEREAAIQRSSGPHLPLRQASPGQYTPGERTADADNLIAADEAVTEHVVAAASDILDGDISEREELDSLDQGLRAEIGAAWTQLSPQAQSSLLQGDRLRLDTKRFAEATGIPGDFALPVFAYCRALAPIVQ